MTFKELRAVVDEDITLWLQDTDDNCIDRNENKYLTDKYDDLTVIKIFNDTYKSISAKGITVILK